ncbi:CAP domain-containing protein [Argonema galeatum A003/A1]|nr:CAP domain-containing protein [Argonema galeatum A003/A1]
MTGVVNLSNSFRAQNGLPPLTMNPQLNASAQAHTTDMALNDYTSHTGLNGSNIGDRALAAGYRSPFVGENIAWGFPTPEAAVNWWMNSPGHRANILNPDYRDIGVGYYFLANDTGNVNYNYYWTQNFGSAF